MSLSIHRFLSQIQSVSIQKTDLFSNHRTVDSRSYRNPFHISRKFCFFINLISRKYNLISVLHIFPLPFPAPYLPLPLPPADLSDKILLFCALLCHAYDRSVSYSEFF